MKIVSLVKNADCLLLQHWRIRRIPNLGSASVFSGFSRIGPTDQADPKTGFRLCIVRVPPVTCRKFLSFFLSPKLVKCQIIIPSEKHLSLTPTTILEQTSLTKTIRKTLPAKIQIQNITTQRNPFKGSFKPLKHFQPNHIP